MQVGVFNDGLSHLSRAQAFAWCATRGIGRIEMGVGGWARAPHQLDLDLFLRERSAREALNAELADHSLGVSCVNAAGNPLHPDRAIGESHRARLRGAVELAQALGVTRVVTMSGCPGGRDDGRTAVFAPWPLVPDDEPLWEWQYNERIAPFWREFCAWARAAAPDVTICLELHAGAAAYNTASFVRVAQAAGPNLAINFDPSHFWWQQIDPLCVIEDLTGRIGFAHAKDTLIHPERVRRHGVIDFRFPVDPATACWHFAAVATGRPADEWVGLLTALRHAGYDGDLSIEHEDPRLQAEEGIEASLAALRAILPRVEADSA